MIPETKKRLEAAYNDLKAYLVRWRAAPHRTPPHRVLAAPAAAAASSHGWIMTCQGHASGAARAPAKRAQLQCEQLAAAAALTCGFGPPALACRPTMPRACQRTVRS